MKAAPKPAALSALPVPPQPASQKKSALELAQDFLVVGISATLSKTVVAPIERVKLLLQTQDMNKRIISGEIPRYSGIFNCMSRCVQDEGMLSLWRGNLANIIRYFPTQALNFFFKDKFKMYLCPWSYKSNPVKFFFGTLASGGAAGATSLLFVYSLDFARTRLGADIGKSASERQFNGLFDCLLKIFRTDGIRGLYQGFGVSVMGITAYRAFSFGVFDTGKRLLPKIEDPVMRIAMNFCFAQTVTAVSSVLSYPFDTVRRKLMMQAGGKQKKYQGTVDCFRKVYQQGGTSAFFKGCLSNVFKGIGSSLVLVMYDEFQRVVAEKKKLAGTVKAH